MRIIAVFALTAALVLSWAPTHADTPVSLRVTLEPSKVSLGDPTTLRLAVTHPAQTTLQFPEAATFEFIGLEVQHIQPGLSPQSPDDNVTTVMAYTVVGFRPSIYVLLPSMLRVGYQTPDGQSGDVTLADPLALEVESVLAELPANPALRGIRPPVVITEPATLLANPAMYMWVALALLLLLFAYWSRHRPTGSLLLTPELRAREALEEAAALLTGSAPAYGPFYTQVSEAIRIYLAQRTDLPTLTSTTRELRRHLEAMGVDRRYTTLILRLLEQCDAAKWAHEYPGPGGADMTLALAFEIVDLLDPEKIPAGEPPSPALSAAGAR